jgi:hypothetical protein
VFKTSGGLQIVYLSGRHDEDRFSQDLSSQETMSPYITGSDVESLKEMAAKSKEDFRGVDVLLTTEWPKGVATHTATPPDWLDADNTGSVAVARLAVAVRPRYHVVAGLKHFYERTPYRNHQVLRGQQLHVTRFIALANVGNPDKKNRYLYAFNITPLTEMDTQELVQQPPAITNCPYHHLLGTKKGERDVEDGGGQQFFFDQKSLDVAGRKRRQQQEGRGGKRNRGDRGAPDSNRPALFSTPPSSHSPHTSHTPPAPRGPCWFCLGSPQVEKHLVITVGDHSYLALPKGGLVPEHVLILPIGHHGASTSTPQLLLQGRALGKWKLAHL